MRVDGFLLLIGVLLVVTPYLGVPESWKSVLVVTLGILLTSMSIYLRHQRTVESGKHGRGAIAMENPHHVDEEQYV